MHINIGIIKFTNIWWNKFHHVVDFDSWSIISNVYKVHFLSSHFGISIDNLNTLWTLKRQWWYWESQGRRNGLGRRNLCVTSPCHFVRVFARVIDRHATLIGGWNERHDRTRWEREEDEGEERRWRRGGDAAEMEDERMEGGGGHAVANLKGRPAGYVVR